MRAVGTLTDPSLSAVKIKKTTAGGFLRF